jgi:hypothetical protein
VPPSETTAPPAWSWDEYEDWLTPQWQHCIQANAHDELAVHHFLEEHPCLLPGGEADSASIGGHHGPWPAVVVSQPPLNGTFLRRPDFLWPTKVSSVFMPVFLELERPDKRWFTASNQQTAELSQAIAQVAEWRTWLESAANQLGFHEMYGVSSAIKSYFRFQPVFHLVYGRRAEFIQDNRKSQMRDSLRPEWLSWSTYDRLTPSANARQWVTVRVRQGDGWQVVAIPPTFDFPSYFADEALQGVVGFETAIAANALISDDRKQYLLDKLSKVKVLPAAPFNLWERELHQFIESAEEPDREPG